MHKSVRASRGARWATLLAGALLVTAAACTSQTEPGAVTPTAAPTVAIVSPATLTVGQDMPAPTGRVVLTVKNAAHPNRGADLALDIALLEQMGVSELTVEDSIAKGGTVRFTGPLLRTVLEYAGLTGASVNMVALNDYTVSIPWSDVTDTPAMVATRADGKLMEIKNYGPTRLVYPTDKSFNLDPNTYDSRRIWQLKDISVT